MEPLLRRVVPERILLVTSPADPLPLVEGSQGDLELALLNLVINGRDAIEGDGTIAITSGLADHEGESRVSLTVRDSGCGMSPAVQERMFDRFFTTKGPEAGTGLGLALVRDVVRKCGGTITISSKPGAGTAVHLLLRPALHEAKRSRGGRRGVGRGLVSDVAVIHAGGVVSRRGDRGSAPPARSPGHGARCRCGGPRALERGWCLGPPRSGRDTSGCAGISSAAWAGSAGDSAHGGYSA